MTKFLTVITLVVTLAPFGMTGEAFAKHGKDDPAEPVSGEGAGHQ
jgi:hypothetical protein